MAGNTLEYYKKMDSGMIKKYLEKIPPINKPITVTYFDFKKKENIKMVIPITNYGPPKISVKTLAPPSSTASGVPPSSSKSSKSPTTSPAPASGGPPTTPPPLKSSKSLPSTSTGVPKSSSSTKVPTLSTPPPSALTGAPLLSVKQKALKSAFQEDDIVNASELYNGLRITASNYIDEEKATATTPAKPAKGNFKKMIKEGKAKHCLFIFNDNIEQYNSLENGGGNAGVREYKKNYKSWGIPTGRNGVGFKNLEKTLYDTNGNIGIDESKFKSAKHYIDEAIKDIIIAIKKRRGQVDFVNEILYSSDSKSKIKIKVDGKDREVHNLGSGIFKINEDVKKYILEQLYNIPFNIFNTPVSTVAPILAKPKKPFTITNNYEKQEGLGCGRHALNNLFGLREDDAFFKKDKGTVITDENINTLDSTFPGGINLSNFCNYYSKKTKELEIINCTYNENYLSELLALVLNTLGYITFTYNEKKENENEKLDENNDNIVGFIAGQNVSMSGGHYIALRKLSNGKYLYVDSMNISKTSEVSMKDIQENKNYNFLIKVRWNNGQPVDNEINKLIKQIQGATNNNSDEMKHNFMVKQLVEIGSRIMESIVNNYKKKGKKLDIYDLKYLYSELFNINDNFTLLSIFFENPQSEKELLDFFDDNFYNYANDIVKKDLDTKKTNLKEVMKLFNAYEPFKDLFLSKLSTITTSASESQPLQLDKPEFTYIKELIDKVYVTGNSNRKFSDVFQVLNPDDKIKTDYASRTYPIIHFDVYIFIIYTFYRFMQTKNPSAKYFDKNTYIDRLFEKRPLAFYESDDKTVCRFENETDCKSTTKTNNFTVPTEDYISYEEMAVSALLGLSGPVHFINEGGKKNQCELKFKTAVEGYLYGLVGARFEKPGEMEWRHIIITQDQNTAANGYGTLENNESLQLWASLYGVDSFPSYDEVNTTPLDTSKYEQYGNNYFNIDIYKKRIKFSLLPFLFDVNERCKILGKKARCFVTGLGLGEWKVIDQQTDYYYEAFFELLRDHKFENIDTFATYLDIPDISTFINNIFTKINVDRSNIKKITTVENTWQITLNDITYKFQAGKINPVEQNLDANLVNFVSYAWDSNSYPGNEFYGVSLDGSMDPATMCSCDALYYHNILANPNITQKNIKTYKFYGRDGIGIYNFGNTCYANASFQILSCIKDFIFGIRYATLKLGKNTKDNQKVLTFLKTIFDILTNPKQKENIYIPNEIDMEHLIITLMRTEINELKANTQSMEFYNKHNINPVLSSSQDSTEFLTHLLDWLEKNTNISLDYLKYSEREFMKCNMEKKYTVNTSTPHKLYEIGFENFTDNDFNVNINQSLKISNTINVESCKNYKMGNESNVNATIHRLYNFGKYIIFHMNLFTHDEATKEPIPGSKPYTINDIITLSYNAKEDFDSPMGVVDENFGTIEEHRYKFIGYIARSGTSINGGHYTFYKYKHNGDKCLLFNDINVIEQKDCNKILNVGDNLANPTAYVLLFKKVDDISGSEDTSTPIAANAQIATKTLAQPTDSSSIEDITDYVNYYLNKNKIDDKEDKIKTRLVEFITYQLGKGELRKISFNEARDEITTKCKKDEHWIWYIIPSKTDNDSRTALNKKFCINNVTYSPVMVSHYLMIPFLKQNYETIICAIYKCLTKNNTKIQEILGGDTIKFQSSIYEFLKGYEELKKQNKETESDNEFINILTELQVLNNDGDKKKQISYNNFITMNGHGSKTDKEFEIPSDSNIYVLIPHEKGLEQAYTVSPPSNPSNFETIIFNNRNIPVFKSNTQYTGWKLYSPGTKINDINISDFGKGDPAGFGSTPCSEIPTKFKNKNKDLVHNCNTEHQPACIVHHDNGLPNYEIFINTDNGKFVYKIKICGKTTLEYVVNLLNKQTLHNLDRPIILIPLLCNASSTKFEKNITLLPEIDKTINIIQLFKKLLIEDGDQEFPILNHNIIVPSKFKSKPFNDKITKILSENFKDISNQLYKPQKQTKKKNTTPNNRKNLTSKNNNTKNAFLLEMYEEMQKKKLSNNDYKCINIYKTAKRDNEGRLGFEEINKFLWGDKTVDLKYKYLAQMLLIIIIENGVFFDHEIILYRNFNFTYKSSINNIRNLKINEEKNFKGLLSTTFNIDKLIEKGSSHLCKKDNGKLIIPANTPFLYIGGYPEEYELLFLPGILVKTSDDNCLGTFKYMINKEHIQEILEIKPD